MQEKLASVKREWEVVSTKNSDVNSQREQLEGFIESADDSLLIKEKEAVQKELDEIKALDVGATPKMTDKEKDEIRKAIAKSNKLITYLKGVDAYETDYFAAIRAL